MYRYAPSTSSVTDVTPRCSHCEVEELRLLLVGPSLGQTRFVQVAVRHAGLDRLGGRAVGEALGDVVVVQHRHVLQGGQSGAPGLLHLEADEKNRLSKKACFEKEKLVKVKV